MTHKRIETELGQPSYLDPLVTSWLKSWYTLQQQSEFQRNLDCCTAAGEQHEPIHLATLLHDFHISGSSCRSRTVSLSKENPEGGFAAWFVMFVSGEEDLKRQVLHACSREQKSRISDKCIEGCSRKELMVLKLHSQV